MAMWRRQPEPLDSPLEILDLRHYSSADLRSLLEEEVQVWSDRLAWDYRSSVDMILRYADAKILPGYAATRQGMLVGYSFFVYEGNKGVIGDLFASEEKKARLGLDTKAVEEILLRHVIETLQQSPGIHRAEAQLLAHDAGLLARPFLDNGFRRYPRIFMTLPLNSQKQGTPVRVPAGIEIRRWMESDYQPVAGVITAAYRQHVDAEINDQYRSMSGALRFLNNIVRFPGCGVFDPSSSYTAVQKSTGTILGVILCSRVKDDVGHVTQVCLVPDQRGRGIGAALLESTAQDLRGRNFSLLTLTVTEANVGAIRVYKKLGYEQNRVFDAFVWEG